MKRVVELGINLSTGPSLEIEFGLPVPRGNDGMFYSFWKLSPEITPYQYSIFRLGDKWMIKRWDESSSSVSICSGVGGIDTAWDNRAEQVYI